MDKLEKLESIMNEFYDEYPCDPKQSLEIGKMKLFWYSVFAMLIPCL